jgi:hypothetical protein
VTAALAIAVARAIAQKFQKGFETSSRSMARLLTVCRR